MEDLKRHLDLRTQDRSLDECLSAFWPLIEPHLPTIVGDLQKRARDFAGGGDGSCDFDRLARVQSRHFARLLAWRIDEDYVDGVLALHFAFRKTAIDPPGITAIYLELSRLLKRRLVETCRWTPATMASIQKAVSTALFMDLSMLLSISRSADEIRPKPPTPERYAQNDPFLDSAERDETTC